MYTYVFVHILYQLPLICAYVETDFRVYIHIYMRIRHVYIHLCIYIYVPIPHNIDSTSECVYLCLSRHLSPYMFLPGKSVHVAFL